MTKVSFEPFSTEDIVVSLTDNITKRGRELALLCRTAASLRISGDSLDPEEITRLVGKIPSMTMKKGDQFTTPRGKSITARTGVWSIRADDRNPGDVDGQVVELLKEVTEDTKIWLELSKRFRVEIFCGLFLEDCNEGLNVSSETMSLLGSRGISLELDIYSAD